jgi:hypothetical protein
MGAKPKVQHNAPHGGVILSRVRDKKGQRFISLINLDQEEKELRITENGHDLFGHPVCLPGRKAKLLPLGAKIAGIEILRASAEITKVGPSTIWIRQSAMPESIEIDGRVTVAHADAKQELVDGKTKISLPPGRGSVRIASTQPG